MIDPQSELLDALFTVYPESAELTRPDTAHLVVGENRLVSRRSIPGVEIRTEETREIFVVHIRIAEGVQIEQPIHSCVGVMGAQGSQNIRLRVEVGSGSSAQLLAHCMFPNAESVAHRMEAHIEVGEGAELRHTEGHFHGTYGGAEVRPRARVKVRSGGRYLSDFSLTEGRVGLMNIEYAIRVGDDAVAEIGTRVFGHGTDRIRIRDEMTLLGRNSRGLMRTRVAVEDDAASEVIGVTHGKAAGARGHMDCMELVRDRAVAWAQPIVDVQHPLAKVTHEAAIGSVDQKQLETLMAHGLTSDEAVDVIIMGLLR